MKNAVINAARAVCEKAKENLAEVMAIPVTAVKAFKSEIIDVIRKITECNNNRLTLPIMKGKFIGAVFPIMNPYRTRRKWRIMFRVEVHLMKCRQTEKCYRVNMRCFKRADLICPCVWIILKSVLHSMTSTNPISKLMLSIGNLKRQRTRTASLLFSSKRARMSSLRKSIRWI